jgi:hypothetical protein
MGEEISIQDFQRYNITHAFVQNEILHLDSELR